MRSFASLRMTARSDWFAALLFLAAYLCTNSYIFGWDDQHLELPLLKHLIDPALYKGDYYVEGLARNFSSFLYPVLARLIKIDQIPAVYLALFLISRYLMFYWLYRLWQLLSGEKFAAAMAVLMFFLMGRTEEFLYRTFSHQEFSYIFMFAGFYYFYRERFILAAALLGLGANFHAVYCLFPMLYMLVYLYTPGECTGQNPQTPRESVGLIFKTGVVFSIFALPFLLWQVPHSLARGHGPPVSEWMPLYLISCPQNFLFSGLPLSELSRNVGFSLMQVEPYVFLLLLYAILCVVEPRLRTDRKTRALIITAYFLILVSCFFAYVYPSRFVLDLNLLRNEQFVRLMLMGYTTIFACRTVKEGKPWQAFAAAVFFFLVGFGSVAYVAVKIKKYFFVLVGMVVVFVVLKVLDSRQKHSGMTISWLRRALIILPLAAAFVSFAVFHYHFVQTKAHGLGFWQFERNWIDMQNYVRGHTPKDALVMTPYDTDMGGFRIFSERKVLVCQRDCGIIGFDLNAAVEWNRRIHDVEGFKMMADKNLVPSLKNAIDKYKVDYIVFMNYYQPYGAIPVLKKIYQNEVMALYEVRR